MEKIVYLSSAMRAWRCHIDKATECMIYFKCFIFKNFKKYVKSNIKNFTCAIIYLHQNDFMYTLTHIHLPKLFCSKFQTYYFMNKHFSMYNNSKKGTLIILHNHNTIFISLKINNSECYKIFNGGSNFQLYLQ